MPRPVRCFQVFIHGQFEERVRLGPDDVEARGFYATRWVVADAEETAIRKAFQSAERELQQWSVVRDGLGGIKMQAEGVNTGSMWRWLRGGGRGFAFYVEE